jgi:glucose-specific phosphotransferase system IIA component
MFGSIFNRNRKTKVYSPMDGKVISLDQVNDPVFSGRMVGEGVAIETTDNMVYAPADGIVTTISRARHAIGMKLDANVELLVHVGLNTNGSEDVFESHIKVGERVKKGDLVISFDFDKLAASDETVVVPVVVLNSQFHSFSNFKIDALSDSRKTVLFEVL